MIRKRICGEQNLRIAFGISALALILLVSSAGASSNGIITGTVTDVTSLAAISGATVTAGDIKATTDVTGSYTINIAPGTYIVTTSATGYDLARASVTVNPRVTVSKDFALTPTTPVVQKIQQIITSVQGLVTSGVLNHGQGNSLIAKLDAAIKNLNKENTNAPINELQAFINKVQANIRAGKLSPAQGQVLIDAANAVIGQLMG